MIYIKTPVLVSACLLGLSGRYDGETLRTIDPVLTRLWSQGYLQPFCPELAGGLSVPRPPAEIQQGSGGSVLSGQSLVINDQGQDVTRYFIRGAESVLQTVRDLHIQVALLKDKSPSCGSSTIYDGTFSGKLKKGEGVSTALLRQNGVRVFGEQELEDFFLFVEAGSPMSDKG